MCTLTAFLTAPYIHLGCLYCSFVPLSHHYFPSRSLVWSGIHLPSSSHLRGSSSCDLVSHLYCSHSFMVVLVQSVTSSFHVHWLHSDFSSFFRPSCPWELFLKLLLRSLLGRVTFLLALVCVWFFVPAHHPRFLATHLRIGQRHLRPSMCSFVRGMQLLIKSSKSSQLSHSLLAYWGSQHPSGHPPWWVFIFLVLSSDLHLIFVAASFNIIVFFFLPSFFFVIKEINDTSVIVIISPLPDSSNLFDSLKSFIFFLWGWLHLKSSFLIRSWICGIITISLLRQFPSQSRKKFSSTSSSWSLKGYPQDFHWPTLGALASSFLPKGPYHSFQSLPEPFLNHFGLRSRTMANSISPLPFHHSCSYGRYLDRSPSLHVHDKRSRFTFISAIS